MLTYAVTMKRAMVHLIELNIIAQSMGALAVVILVVVEAGALAPGRTNARNTFGMSTKSLTSK